MNRVWSWRGTTQPYFAGAERLFDSCKQCTFGDLVALGNGE
jgi:hypothetical protein